MMQPQPEPKKVEKPALPIVISARTGLTSADDALMRTLPQSYRGKTIEEALGYVLQKGNRRGDEAPLAKSIQEELQEDNVTVTVNGNNVDLSDKVADHLARQEHKLPNEQVKPYLALEIEVSAVQEGGHYLR